MSLNGACSVAFCKCSALGSAGSQFHLGFVEPQKALPSWKWERAYKVLDNHSSLHIWRLIVAETKHFLEGGEEKLEELMALEDVS